MTPAFLITIDTEGDNLWSRRTDITTRNTVCLPRFQRLCEHFNFPVTWLTNYEMAMDPAFVEFGRDVIARGCGEIGMHLHAWNSPPTTSLTDDDMRHHPYLIEYPDSVMREKIAFMTDLLETRFGCKMLSHRAGRWAFDERYARMLLEAGYEVDCSVTPGVSWRAHKGAPDGRGGSDYRRFPDVAYFPDPDDLSRPGRLPLLEVPMTTRRSTLASLMPPAYSIPGLRGVAHRVVPEVLWLRPNGRNLRHMLNLVRTAVSENRQHIEFMLHSSELMPGGSPTFGSANDIERLYDDLASLFAEIARHFTGMTLAGFAQTLQASAAR